MTFARRQSCYVHTKHDLQHVEGTARRTALNTKCLIADLCRSEEVVIFVPHHAYADSQTLADKVQIIKVPVFSEFTVKAEKPVG